MNIVNEQVARMVEAVSKENSYMQVSCCYIEGVWVVEVKDRSAFSRGGLCICSDWSGVIVLYSICNCVKWI